jgi:hypothetical protein
LRRPASEISGMNSVGDLGSFVVLALGCAFIGWAILYAASRGGRKNGEQ